MQAPASIGLPYGSYPRLLLAWLNTEAVRTRSRHLELGRTFSSFVRQLGLVAITGKRGTNVRLREQMNRLFSTSIRCVYFDPERGCAAGRGYMISQAHELWWSPKDPEKRLDGCSRVSLSEEFYREIVRHAVPVDLRALRSLKRSAMALDIYAWLIYRSGFVRKPVLVPWEALAVQFGADYSRARDFKRKFLARLGKVVRIYPDLRFSHDARGLTLKPSPPHIRRGVRHGSGGSVAG